MDDRYRQHPCAASITEYEAFFAHLQSRGWPVERRYSGWAHEELLHVGDAWVARRGSRLYYGECHTYITRDAETEFGFKRQASQTRDRRIAPDAPK